MTVNFSLATVLQKFRILFHFSLASFPDMRLAVAMAPALTRGLPVCVGISTTAGTELNARPDGSEPIRSNALPGPSPSIARARVKTFEMDWM